MPSFFPMPLFGDLTLLLTAVGSGILCMILGYLLGYFTTHRSHSDYLGAQRQLANLQGQNFRQQTTSVGIPLGDASVAALPPRKSTADSTKPTFPAANDARLVELQQLSDGLAARNEQLTKELREERQLRSQFELAASRSPAVDSLTDTDWQIGKLNQEVIGLQRRLDSKQDENDGLTSQRDDAETARRAAAQSLDELRGLLGQGEAVVASLERDKSDLRNQVNDLQTRLALAEDCGDSQTSEEELSSLRGTIESLKQNLDQRDLAILSMERELSNLRIARDRVASLEISIAERNNFAERLSQQLVAAAADKKTVSARFEELNREFKSRDETLESVKSELDAALRRTDELEAEQRNSASTRVRLEESVAELQSREAELSVAIRDFAHNREELRVELAEQSRDNELARTHADQNAVDLQARIEELSAVGSELISVRAELESTRQQQREVYRQLQEAESSAADELKRNELQTAQIRDLEVQLFQLKAEFSEVSQLRQRVAELDSNAHQSATSLAASQEVISKLAAELHEIAELSQREADPRQQLEDARLRIDQLDTECRGLQAQTESAEHVSAESRAEIDNLTETIRILKNEHESLRQRDADIQLLQVAQNEKLGELDAIRARFADLEQAGRQAESEFADREQRLTEQISKSEVELSDKLAKADEQQALLTTELRTIRAEAEKLRSELELKSQAAVESDFDAIGELNDKYKSAVERASRAERELTDSRNELYRQSEAANTWRQERAELLDQLEQMEQNYKQLDEKVSQPSTPEPAAILDPNVERLAKHNQELALELRQAQSQADKQKSQLRDVAAALSAARRELAALRSELSEVQAILLTSQAPCLSEATTSDATVPSKRTRSARPRSQTPNDDASVHKKSAKSNRNGGSRAAKHPLLGKVYSQEPKEMDDLREIKGLGPAFEKRLHELGIFQFSQIVKWKSSVTMEIAKLLGTSDRKVSAWIEEAGKLNRGRST